MTCTLPAAAILEFFDPLSVSTAALQSFRICAAVTGPSHAGNLLLRHTTRHRRSRRAPSASPIPQMDPPRDHRRGSRSEICCGDRLRICDRGSAPVSAHLTKEGAVESSVGDEDGLAPRRQEVEDKPAGADLAMISATRIRRSPSSLNNQKEPPPEARRHTDSSTRRALPDDLRAVVVCLNQERSSILASTVAESGCARGWCACPGRGFA